MEMSTLLNRSTGCQHQLEPAIQNDFISIPKSAENGDPATIIEPQIRFDSNGFIGIVRSSTENHWNKAISLNSRQWDGQFAVGRGIRDDLELS